MCDGGQKNARRARRLAWLRAAVLLFVVLAPAVAAAFPINISFGGGGAASSSSTPGQVSNALKVLAALTVLSLAPAILMLMTCFTRIVIVLSFARQALGTQNMPPNQVLVGLALLLTFFVMMPIGQKIHRTAITPYLEGKLGEKEAIKTGLGPLREFMLDQTRAKDLALLLDLTHTPPPQTRADVPLLALVPAFVLSELSTAFQMGFLIFIPFILLDFIVASVLMSMGMVMLPPSLVSLPLKIMLFVLVDGWQLIIGSVLRSVHA